LKSLGVDKHLLIRFNKSFSELRAAEFVEKVLVEKTGVRYCFVGDDFRFGKDREGDFSMLKKMSLELNFGLQKINGVSIGGLRVSSSEIRKMLTKGDFKSRRNLFGKAFFNKWKSCTWGPNRKNDWLPNCKYRHKTKA
jgi:riboflavin kinase/FMN adenylyltransferase